MAKHYEGILAHCAICRFVQRDDDEGASQCRRYPPTPTSKSVGQFPYVKDTDWCGEFVDGRPREGRTI